MRILGISCFYHESAVALIKNGNLIAAAAEERFSRKKHDNGFPTLAATFCLAQGKISARDLDWVVFYEKPFLKFERLVLSALQTIPNSLEFFRESMLAELTQKLWVKNVIREKVGVDKDKILFVPHHVAHAASAYYSSPFDKSAILTLDGVGEWSTGVMGVAEGNKLNLKKELRFPHSLGLLYSAFTAYLGFEVNDGEYKVMGMAPYGEPKYTNQVWQLLKQNSDGSIRLNLEFFSFHHSVKRSVSEKFLKLFGPPREKDLHFFTPLSGYPSYFGEKPSNYKELAEKNQYYADIAASIQKVTEEVILRMVEILHKETKMENLCFAGGVALNSVANGRIIRESSFKNLYVQPAPGDDGGSLGAALYVYHHILNKPRSFVMNHAYWGKSFTQEEIENFLKERQINYRKIEEQEKLAAWIAKELAHEKVIGLFQGRFEWGPRALGNRSILADPRREEMKDIVNTKIKFREPYRPFAPVVLEEKAQEYFEISDVSENYSAKFMLMVCPVRKEKRKVISAVTHVDGSGRLQTVDKKTNPLYRGIIEEFEKLTGVAVLLNTSFNLKGEPIVNSPLDAYNTFMKSGLDYLVMERFVVSKD